jgi:hypothetical protein
MTDTATPPCETEAPDLDDIALDLRLVASLVPHHASLDLAKILTDLADAVDTWHAALGA